MSTTQPFIHKNFTWWIVDSKFKDFSRILWKKESQAFYPKKTPTFLAYPKIPHK